MKKLSVDAVQKYMAEYQKRISHLTLPTGEEVQMSASAGGAAFPEQGEDVMALCRNADVALYEVKQNGKNAFKMRGM